MSCCLIIGTRTKWYMDATLMPINKTNQEGIAYMLKNLTKPTQLLPRAN